MIYRMVVERILRNAFAALNRGDYAPVLGSFGTPVEHVFFGDHALAGSRRSMATIGPWYVRLKNLLPDVRFDIDSVAVSGWPWNTVALVEWRDHFTLRDGTPRSNQGVHALRLKWGKVVSLRIYCDTQVLAAALQDLRDQGVAEAGMAPISG
ncbi:MAG: nuclear transport factor 2 family protein [Pseudomonadota bacterium]